MQKDMMGGGNWSNDDCAKTNSEKIRGRRVIREKKVVWTR